MKIFDFKMGKGEVLVKGKDVAIIATGIMVAKALEAKTKKIKKVKG